MFVFFCVNFIVNVLDWNIYILELIVYLMLEGMLVVGVDLEQKQYVWNMNYQLLFDDFVYIFVEILVELYGMD